MTKQATTPTLSSSAKADDPVRRDASVSITDVNVYWMPAFAGMTNS